MENLNIKDYLQLNSDTTTKTKKPVEYKYTLVFDNGSDFIIERETGRGIKRQLCFIASENLLYIRDPKTNKDNPINSKASIRAFFDRDDNVRNLEFKNEFFRSHHISDFSYVLNNLHKEKKEIKRFLIQRGMNPYEYISTPRYGSSTYVDVLDNTGDLDGLLKIFKLVDKYRDKLVKKNGEYTPQINAEFMAFLYSIKKKFSIDYVNIFLDIYTSYDSKLKIDLSNYANGTYTSEYKYHEFEAIIDNYNVDFKRYLTYLFRDLYAEGISTIDNHILREYDDCLNMQKEIYGKVRDKYPTHFKESHDKIVLVYNLNLQYFKEKKIQELKIHNQFLEYSNGKYSVIVAKTSQDLIQEGIDLHHCVGSYVDKVQNGECSIFFLRKIDEIDKSLITIEVIKDRIIQVRGLCERLMDDEERKFLMEWTKVKGLKLISE